MDKNSNSKIQFRLPNDLSENFKTACHQLDVKHSEKLRDLMCDFLDNYEVEVLNREPYIFPKFVSFQNMCFIQKNSFFTKQK